MSHSVSFYITKNIPCVIIIIWSYDLRDNTSTVNIHREGNLISEESIFNDVPVLWFIANEYVRTFYFVVVVASSAFDAEKNSKHLLFHWFSYPNNYGGDDAGTYLDAEISFATYGKYFPKTRKASPNPCCVWYHCERWKFCRLPRLSFIFKYKETIYCVIFHIDKMKNIFY